ncbi:hypothetical protein C0J45_22322 [Silurus meridionalis]|uniref:Ubiquitin-like domain-containing protein n=1 Tax=Silurus meridionalis TaxID=175797 RepID=A0A8T0A5H6_SILME|nr:hypothetical protein HF521_015412 [Silurus meridionalis]KAI5087833.1 hypothetical protein C0J45_22322 [Silurus meridionalis]
MTSNVCVPQVKDVYYRWTPPEIKPSTQHRPDLPSWASAEIKPLSLHSRFLHTTHSVLQVCYDAPDSPRAGVIKVQVFDPSKDLRIPLTVKSTDSAATLIKKCLEQRPDLGETLNLVYNGKPVPLCKSLGELGVKSGAMFITYQKCFGG